MTKKDRKLPIGSQIALARQERGLSLSALVTASAGTITKGGISRIESLEREPSIPTLVALARGMKCEFHIEANGAYLVLV